MYDLRLTPEVFWTLTPRQFDNLMARKKSETRSNEFMIAQLTAICANFSMCRPEKPVKVRDLMPSMADYEDQERPDITDEDRRALEAYKLKMETYAHNARVEARKAAENGS